MAGNPFEKMLKYASLVGEIGGTLSIHEESVKGLSMERRDSLFRMHQAETTLNRIKELLKEFYES